MHITRLLSVPSHIDQMKSSFVSALSEKYRHLSPRLMSMGNLSEITFIHKAYGAYATGIVRRLFHHKSYDSSEPGRRQEDSYDFWSFLDIVRCSVKLR